MSYCKIDETLKGFESLTHFLYEDMSADVVFPKENSDIVIDALKLYKIFGTDGIPESVWGGLARDVMMGFDMQCRTFGKLKRHLRMSASQKPWPVQFKKEMDRDDEEHITKGDCVCLILTAAFGDICREIEKI